MITIPTPHWSSIVYLLTVKNVREFDHLPAGMVSVEVATADGGSEFLLASRRSLQDGALEIGYPVNQDGDRLFVQFPLEADSGARGAWVDATLVRKAPPAKTDNELRLEAVLRRIAEKSGQHFAVSHAQAGLAGWDPRA